MAKKIFKNDKGRIAGYLRILANHMGLRDWTIVVSDKDPDNPDAEACAIVTYGTKYIAIRFDPDWASSSERDFQHACVHELLHAHFAPMQWAIQNAELPLGSTAYHILRASHHDALEVALDAIASEWSATLPLPYHKDEL